MLKCIVVSSANDGPSPWRNICAASEEVFVQKMNERALVSLA
jgi:D-alanyl-D-alanine carboxypeptidase